MEEDCRERNPSEMLGWRLGDICEWTNDGRVHRAKIRFIGYLAGHSSLYAGIEFEEQVGQGTGMYQGQELFSAPLHHAGFVMLATLDRPSYQPKHSKSYPMADEGPSEDSRSTLPRPFSGPHPKSNSDISVLPPRPVSSETAYPPSGKERLSSPPPVPPRPNFLAEDFMIDSFQTGSCVDVCHLGAKRSGVIKWLGDAYSADRDRLQKSAVVELESCDVPAGWRLSSEADLPVTSSSSTVLVPVCDLRRDRRFLRDSSPSEESEHGSDFGSIDSGIETMRCEPAKGVEELIGRRKGIQGHRNSCYLDATLYALFVQCTALDHILTRKRTESDVEEYDELMRILTTEIVWPLRKFHYVRADHMMKLRRLLEKLMPSIKGMTSQEKDPEEILSILFRDLFKVKPFLQLISSKDGKVDSSWMYHCVVEKEWQGGQGGIITTTQHLIEKSMRKDYLKFAECPQVLFLLLPRYGPTKIFDKIVPLEKLDVTFFVNNAGFTCMNCSKLAEVMCEECYLTKQAVFRDVCYCTHCFRPIHMARGLADHFDRPLSPAARPPKKASNYSMILSSVLCIETSHYVTFVRSLQGRWLFFDSMADREGLSQGFNIPQVRECEKMAGWLTMQGYGKLREGSAAEDPLVNRLLSDAYLCVYTAENAHSAASSASTFIRNLVNK